MKRIIEVERHGLSDGGLAVIKKMGREYIFMRTHSNIYEAPETIMNLTKSEALDILANTLRNDICEVE